MASKARKSKPPRAKTNSRPALAQLGFLAASRRRQREVFGPAIIAVVMGSVLFLDALIGSEIPEAVQTLLMLLMGGWAGITARRMFQKESHRTTTTNTLTAGGALLVAGAVARLLDINLILPWAALLVLFALATWIRE